MSESLITEIDILDEAQDCFLTFAEEVLTDRAIPSAEDGLLSVHRKLIWTMEEILKMDSKTKYKKSASVVGSTLASSYFHGDAACYGAMCKLAQPYLMRYPLVDGDGNFGSQQENGTEAASRYTNARPSKYSDLMMIDFKKNTVPLKETYNGEYMEPVVLPSLLPNALVNGREAIGVSMAHNSQPMNLTEVSNGIIAYIKNKNIDINGLMEYIKGPDYPLGNVVINAKDIKAAFATGHSEKSLKVRGDYIIDGNKIIFTSIPYRTYRKKISEQIANNIDTFDKLISDYNDESSIGENKLIFVVKPGVSSKTVLNKLFSLTDLQTTISYNMNFIVNGTPKLCSLKDLIVAYYEHQINVIINATNYDKEKAEARAHIIEGLLAAIDKIDEVIKIIKASENKSSANKNLREYLNIDEIQANAILDMKLSKLTRIDKNELVDELQEKKNIIAECIKILNDSDYRDSILIEKIEYMRDKYGDSRRTQLLDLAEEPKEEKEIVNVEPEKCIVVMTESGLIKRVPTSTFKVQKRNGKGIKNQDDIVSTVIRTNTIDSLMVFSNFGKMYRILVDDIPVGTNTTKGSPITSLIEMERGEQPNLIYSIYRDTTAKYVLFTTKNGVVKKTGLEEYTKTKKKTGMIAINLKENDSLANVQLIGDEDILIVTRNGSAIKINSKEIGITSRATAGVKGINLNEGDEVVTTLTLRNSSDYLALFGKNGTAKKIKSSELLLQKRGGKGVIVHKPGNVVAASLVEDSDQVLIVGTNNTICIKASDIPVAGKLAQGNVVIKGDIKAVSKI